MAHRVVIHIGPHKTGSTALQNAFVAHRETLAEHGIKYPYTAIYGAGHHMLAKQLRGIEAGVHTDDLLAEAAHCDTLLLSSEMFSAMGPKHLEALRDLFSGMHIEIVYHLRKLVDIWPSHWRELVKHGAALPFGKYLAQAFTGQADSDWAALTQHGQLDKFQSVFGAQSIRIVGYDMLCDTNRDIAEHFMRDILDQPEIAQSIRSDVHNRALADWQTELIRALNRIHREQGLGVPDGILREVLLTALKDAQPEWLPEFNGLVSEAKTLTLDSTTPSIRFLQRRLIEDFGDMIVGDRAHATGAFLRPTTNEVRLFELPFSGHDALRRGLLAYHADLVKRGPPETDVTWQRP